MSQEQADKNYYDEWIRLRDEDRRRRERGAWIIKGSDLPWETNPQGVMRWFMHPAKDDTVHQSLVFLEQEIPPGSRSGRQRYQGGVICYVRAGKGYTLVDGVRHDWKTGDLLQLPIRPEGVVYQHFNEDSQQPARLLICEPNMIGALGVDRGSGMEQLAPCPEHRAEGPSTRR